MFIYHLGCVFEILQIAQGAEERSTRYVKNDVVHIHIIYERRKLVNR